MNVHENLAELEVLINRGWWLLPIFGLDGGSCSCRKSNCTAKGKHPIIKNGMDGASNNFIQIKNWFETFPGCNWAVNCKMSNLLCIDVDPRNGGDESIALIESHFQDSLPETVMARTGVSRNLKGLKVRGIHYYFSYFEQLKLPKNLNRIGYPGVDLKYDGYVVIPPSAHASGESYEWVEGKNPAELNPAELPIDLESFLLPKLKKTKVGNSEKNRLDFKLLWEISQEPVDLDKFLNTPLFEGERNSQILRAACAMASRIGTHDAARLEILDIFRKFNSKMVIPTLDDHELTDVVVRAINWIATRKSEEVLTIPTAFTFDEPSGRLDIPISDLTTDSQMAQLLGRKYFENQLVWCDSMKWLAYESGYWHQVPTEFVVEQVRQVITKISLEVHKRFGANPITKKALSFESNNKIYAFVNLMKGVCLVDDDIFDQNHDLLNAKNGVVDLKTGKLLPHSPSYYFTKTTRVDYLEGAKHPDLDKVLAALPNETLDFLQLKFGQGISGNSSPSDTVTFLTGMGQNGKSSLLTLMRSALGDFLTFLPQKVIMGNKFDHPTELMTLRATRLAVLEELPEGQELPVAQIKRITGVPEITARAIGQNNKAFKPTHTLFITTNALPYVTQVDHGTWRRFEVIVFPYTFSNDISQESETVKLGDPHLRDRLTKSLDGQAEAMLSWLVQGSVNFHKLDGKFPPLPLQIKQSTEEWRKSSDIIYAFLEENFDFGPELQITSQELYAKFNDKFGPGISDNTISTKLKNHGYLITHGVVSKRMNLKVDGIEKRVMVWAGMGLKRQG